MLAWSLESPQRNVAGWADEQAGAQAQRQICPAGFALGTLQLLVRQGVLPTEYNAPSAAISCTLGRDPSYKILSRS